MPKVICTLPNASNNINGFDFEDHPDGKISVDLPEEVAANFASIEGYSIATQDEANPEKKRPSRSKREAEQSGETLESEAGKEDCTN